MPSKFTERDTESYYDAEDAVYRSFWDQEGSLHWGLFDEGTGRDFLKASANLNRVMLEKSGIQRGSKLLDLGCGNGTTSMWLSRTRGCRVEGIDLSGVRIGNARAALDDQPAEVSALLGFEKASVTELPYGDGSFTHVWSQAAIYHVHDKEKALQEAYRVLQDGGIFAFDDLTKPRAEVGEAARKWVYDRLLFDTEFSFDTYQDALRRVGFRVLEAQDLSAHLKTSYQCLAEITRSKGNEAGEKFRALSFAYEQMVQAVDRGELGWALYLCQK